MIFIYFLSISADEISVSDVTLQSIGELEDFNEEEDYVKFLQKRKYVSDGSQIIFMVRF